MADLQLQPINKGEAPEFDTLHFSDKRIPGGRRKQFKGYINIVRFVDKDTKQVVLYAPALELSGYGENADKAFYMIKESISTMFDWLSDLSQTEMQAELAKFGWKKNKFRNKDFSRAYVDNDGNLKNINAVDDKVERLALVAA